jgi:hypothetical protein
LSLEEPLTEEEKRKQQGIINDPDELNRVIDKALKGWHGGRELRRVASGELLNLNCQRVTRKPILSG